MTDSRLFAGLHALSWQELTESTKAPVYLVDAENPTAGEWVTVEPVYTSDEFGRMVFRGGSWTKQTVCIYRREMEAGRQIVFNQAAGIIAEGRQKGELE